MTRRLAVVAHFDADGEVKPHVLRWVEGIHGFADRVVFASTAPALDDRSRGQLERLGILPRLMENRGFDFGMWARVLAELGPEGLRGYEELILTNSSVYGPVGDLGAVFEAMGLQDLELWGLTESQEVSPHVQSYFLVFRRAALEHPAFRAFFGSVLPYRSKRQVVLSYELGLSTFCAEAGLRGGAFRTAGEVGAGRSNPTLLRPVELLERGVPAVKVQAIRDNPGRVDLRSLLLAMSTRGYPLDLVRSSLPGIARSLEG